MPERSKFNANYEAQEVMNIEANTEKQLVCACIEASSQFHCLLNRLHLKYITLEQMISNLYKEGKQDSARDVLMNLNKAMVQCQQLRETVIRVKSKLDEFIHNKQKFIPCMLLDTIE